MSNPHNTRYRHRATQGQIVLNESQLNSPSNSTISSRNRFNNNRTSQTRSYAQQSGGDAGSQRTRQQQARKRLQQHDGNPRYSKMPLLTTGNDTSIEKHQGITETDSICDEEDNRSNLHGEDGQGDNHSYTLNGQEIEGYRNEHINDQNHGHQFNGVPANINVSTTEQDFASENRSSFGTIGDTREGDDIDKRKLNLMKVYSQGLTVVRNDNTKTTILNSVRSIIIPHVKFVTTSKVFGSFEQPDFTDENCWQNKLFGNIVTLKGASDKMKAEVWMTYRAKIKEQFSLHRSSTTLKIKRKFLDGK